MWESNRSDRGSIRGVSGGINSRRSRVISSRGDRGGSKSSSSGSNR